MLKKVNLISGFSLASYWLANQMSESERYIGELEFQIGQNICVAVRFCRLPRISENLREILRMFENF